jgi:hypothetical protein
LIVSINDNNNHHQTFYRPPIQMNNSSWTMRNNNYQNLTRKSMNKTRHNSMSKEIILNKIEFRILKNKSNSYHRSIGHKTFDNLPNKTSPLIIKMYNLRELGKLKKQKKCL